LGGERCVHRESLRLKVIYGSFFPTSYTSASKPSTLFYIAGICWVDQSFFEKELKNEQNKFQVLAGTAAIVAQGSIAFRYFFDFL
jgi:hypothetical protein